MDIQQPLTAVMRLKPGRKGVYDPKAELKKLLKRQGHVVLGALQRLGFVHSARFVFFKFGRAQYFAIITTYDFAFDDYINVFIDELGDQFDGMLEHIDGAEKCIPVRKHRRQFIEYVRKVDFTNSKRLRGKDALFYSAYPNLSVQHVWTLEKQK